MLAVLAMMAELWPIKLHRPFSSGLIVFFVCSTSKDVRMGSKILDTLRHT